MLRADLLDPVELAIPASRKMLIVVRLTTSGVLARAGIGVDRMEDVKLAAEEACLCLMEQEARPDRVRVTFGRNGDRFIMFARREGDVAAPVGEGREAEVVRGLLESLADEVEVETDGGSIASIAIGIRLSCG